MPIRIGPTGPVAPPMPETEVPMEETLAEEMPTEAPVEIPEALPMEQPKFSGDKVDPAIARYMTSDLGPFICANCEHFTDTGECEVVSGPIDPEGVCILFTPPEPEQDLEGVAEEVIPEEIPEEQDELESEEVY